MSTSAVIGALRVNLSANAAEFLAGLDGAEKALKNAGARMQSIGASMSAAITAPIVGMGALTLRAAGNFEASMNRVGAALDAPADVMAQLSEAAKEMGRTTQFSASEAGDAIEVLAKNGLNASQILGGALQASLTLAAASGADLAAAGDLATDVMLNFGKEAGDLQSVVDGVSGVLLASKFGFDDYRLALAQAGGVAGGLGVDLEEFNAVIAATSAAFASGSDAGTSFKTFLQRLVPASGPAADAMERLGLEFHNADGSMKSMAEVAQELQDKMSGLSQRDLSEAMSDIFGTDAMRTAIGLMKTGGDGIEELNARIQAASASEQAAARMEGFNGAMKRLASAFEALQLAIADSGLLDLVTGFVEGLAGLIAEVSEADPKIMKFGTVFAALAAAMGPALVALGLAATGVAAIGMPVTLAVAGVAALAAAFAAMPPVLFASASEASKLSQASDEVTKAIGDEIRQTQLLKQELGQATTMSVEAARQKLQEAVARNQNVKAIIAELRALALGSDRYATLTRQIADAQSQLNATGFPTIDAASRRNADAFEAAQKRLAGLLIERQKLLESDEEVSQQLRDTEDNVAKLTAALADAENGVVSFGNSVVTPVEPGERLGEILGNIGDAATGAGGETRDALESIRSAYDGLISSLDPATGASLRFAEAQDTINAALKAGIITSEDAARASDLARERRDEELGRATDAVRGLGDEIAGPFKEALRSGDLSFRSFAGALMGVAERLRDRLIDEAFKPIEAAIKELFSGAGTSGAGGGPLSGLLGTVLKAAVGGIAGGVGGINLTGSAGITPDGSFVNITPETGFSAGLYARGTTYHPGGLAVVGDGGEPELLNLPRGTRVTPLSDAMGRGAGMDVRVYLDPNTGGLAAQIERISGGVAAAVYQQREPGTVRAVERSIASGGSGIDRALTARGQSRSGGGLR